MSVLNIQRNFNGDPNIVTMIVTNTFNEITTNGYLTTPAIMADIVAIQGGEFEWQDTDVVLIYYSAGVAWFTRNSSTNSFISMAAGGGLSSTLSSANLFVGNASNVATARAMTGDAAISNTGVFTIGNGVVTGSKIASNTISSSNIQNGAIGSAQVASNLIKYTTVPITSANILGMYATPVTVLASAGVNTMILVDKMALSMTFNSIGYVGGGGVALQYGSAAHGAGEPASGAISPNDIQGGSSIVNMVDGTSNAFFTDASNISLYLSNTSAAFTTGNSAAVLHLWYRIISLV